MSLKWVQRIAFRTVSQIGIHYRKSILSESQQGLPGGAPRAGDRFPWMRLRFQAGGPVEDSFRKLDDTTFNLVVIGQPALPESALALGDLLRIHIMPSDPVNDAEFARTQIPRPSFYLIRPDGHVGLCGIRLEAAAVKRYVAERLNLQLGSA